MANVTVFGEMNLQAIVEQINVNNARDLCNRFPRIVALLRLLETPTGLQSDFGVFNHCLGCIGRI
jgi:hypothetical protein